MSTAQIRPRKIPLASRRSPRRPFHPWKALPWLEPLEDRVLLSITDLLGSAQPLSFAPSAHATANLGNPSDVQLYQITLAPGDVVTASVDTARYGGGLDSYLRIFQDLGGGAVQEIAANDNLQGRDPGVTFQAVGVLDPVVYYVGISSFDNRDYDAGVGTSHGLFDLNLRIVSPTAAPEPILVASSFIIDSDVAEWDEDVVVHFDLQNRGAADTIAGTYTLLAATDNRFSDAIEITAPTGFDPIPAGGFDPFLVQVNASLWSTLAPSLEGKRIFLGVQVEVTLPSSPAPGNAWAPLQVLQSIGDGEPLALNSRTTSIDLAGGDQDFFQIDLTEPGNLLLQLDGAGGPMSLTLCDANDLPIVRSDGQVGGGPEISHTLVAGTYTIKVANLRDDGDYRLTTRFTRVDSPLSSIPLVATGVVLVKGDFNGDGSLDLVTGNWNNLAGLYPVNNVTVLLGNGDGSFQIAGSFSVDGPPHALVSADFNGDGVLDLASATPGTDGVRVLLGVGDGSFGPAVPVGDPGDLGGESVVAADFNNDGWADLAVGISEDDQIRILLNHGDATFAEPVLIGASDVIAALAVGDFNGDNEVDLAAVDSFTDQIAVYTGDGAGNFVLASVTGVAGLPIALAVADFNGDTHLDLAVAQYESDTVTILLGDGAASFSIANPPIAVGGAPYSVVTADFNADGIVDIATTDSAANSVSVALGHGDGSFEPGNATSVDSIPESLVAGDFDNDGQVDLGVMNYGSASVSVLLGRGGSLFPKTGPDNVTGQFPVAVVQGDVNGDGHADLITADRLGNDITVLLGQGDGTFVGAGRFAVGRQPKHLVAGDFNGDGRLDVVTGNYYYAVHTVSVLLGNGDGTFQDAVDYDIGGRPGGLVAADFDGDFNLDLAASISIDSYGLGSRIVVLLGEGDGTFAQRTVTDVGLSPRALVTGDFGGDALPDLAVANYFSADVTILISQEDGIFASLTHSLPGAPFAFPVNLVAGDFDGDLLTDIVVGLYSEDLVMIRQNSDGSFQDGPISDAAVGFDAMMAGDFDGDGVLDLATANRFAYYYPVNTATVLLGDGVGGFVPTPSFAAGSVPDGLAVGYFNNDNHLDFAVTSLLTSNVNAFLGVGNGTFVSPVLAVNPARATPLAAPLISTDVLDTVVLSQTGRILFRRGLEDQPGAFAPPVVLNPGVDAAARDLALVRTASGGWLVAALSAHTVTVTFYVPQLDGSFITLAGVNLMPGVLPGNIAAADLNLDGRDDLVLSTAAGDQIFVRMQTIAGTFAEPDVYTIGINASALELIDLDGDNFRDIVVTSRFSGQVLVLRNDQTGAFSPGEPYRADTSPYAMASINGGSVVQSLAGTTGVVGGSFDDSAGTDLVALNAGTNSFSLLSGNALGGVLNPSSAHVVALENAPTAFVAADFDNDSDFSLAVLSKERGVISIYQPDGLGGFTLFFTIGAGNQPTGLSVADVTQPGGGGPDGVLDLLVGNIYGDLLVLPGNHDDTFGEYRRADQRVSLAVSDAAGQRAFYFSNQGSDELAYQRTALDAKSVEGNVYQARSAGIQAPGPQTIVSVLGIQYLVVANSGSNEVMVYTLDAGGAPDLASLQTYFTGTDPSCLAVTDPTNDLNGDFIPDLVVANRGSNDVSVFLGKIVGGAWTLSYRPRQSTAGTGPSAIAIADVTNAAGTGAPDGIADLLVSNAQSGAVSVLPNRGGGFFINQPPATPTFAPETFPGVGPRLLYVGDFDGSGSGAGLDLVSVNALSNNITLVRNFAFNPIVSTITSGGTQPGAAVVLDFDQNGIMDLLVANVDNGALELLSGGPNGFAVADTFSLAAAVNLSDLAVIAVGNQVDVYGTLAGQEVAVLLATFGPPAPTPTTLPPSPGFPQGLEINTSLTFALNQDVITSSQSFLNLLEPEKKVDDDNSGEEDTLGEEATESSSATYGSTEAGGGGGGADADPNPARRLLNNLDPPPVRPPQPPPEENEEDSDFDPFGVDGSEPTKAKLSALVASPAGHDDFTLPPIALDEGSASAVPDARAATFERLVVELEPERTATSATDAETETPDANSRVGSAGRAKASAWMGLFLALPAIATRIADAGRSAYERLRSGPGKSKSQPRES